MLLVYPVRTICPHQSQMTLTRIARSRAGFTLIELIVAIVLMGAIAGIALPRVGEMLSRSKINQAASVVVSTLRESATLAARRRAPVRVSIDAEQRVLRLMNHEAPDTVFRTLWLDASGELALSNLTVSDTQLVVFPNGWREKATAWDMWLTLEMGEAQRTVTMRRGGQIRITTP